MYYEWQLSGSRSVSNMLQPVKTLETAGDRMIPTTSKVGIGLAMR